MRDVVALSSSRIQGFFATGDGAMTAYDRGRSLEELVKYAFSQVPGVEFYKSNVVNHAHSEEVDVAFFNNKFPRGFPFLEYLLLVECKNWSSPVGANHVREFVAKLKHRACAYGVLIAANGITGDPVDKTAAHDAIRMALATEQIRVIVVTRTEIESWTDTKDIVDLFKRKLCEITVDGSIFA